MATPQMLYFEDFEVGRTVPLGTRRITREEMIAFAAEFDPLPHHLDEAAARASPLGGLAASGWHLCALHMRMMCDAYLLDSSSLGSPGLEAVRWHASVRPGDTLKAQYTCRDARVSGRRPDMGICNFLYEVFNQHGDLVMTWDCTQFFSRRPAGGHA